MVALLYLIRMQVHAAATMCAVLLAAIPHPLHQEAMLPLHLLAAMQGQHAAVGQGRLVEVVADSNTD